MIPLTTRPRERTPQSEPDPDRRGTILGLSLTGFREVAYVDWGPADAGVPVLCVHGLSRQGRDFDYLAAELAGMRRRVVCPDLVGRGRSGRLRSPNEYALPQYCADMNALVARLGAEETDLVGTSLGGLIGMVLAGMPRNSIRRLVINDIGPFLPWKGLARIGTYLSAMPALSGSGRGRSLFPGVSGSFWRAGGRAMDADYAPQCSVGCEQGTLLHAL